MQIFVVTREASKVKTLDIDTSDSIEVIKAFIDLKIGVESSQQRWAVMESEKIPSWLGRLGSTIYNMVGSVSDMVGIPIGKKTTFKQKISTYVLPHCPVGLLGALATANLTLRLFEEKKIYTTFALFIGFGLGFQLSSSLFNHTMSRTLMVIRQVDKVPKPMDIDPTDTIENVKKCILKNKGIPLDQQVFVIVQDYDHGIPGLLDVLV